MNLVVSISQFLIALLGSISLGFLLVWIPFQIVKYLNKVKMQATNNEVAFIFICAFCLGFIVGVSK